MSAWWLVAAFVILRVFELGFMRWACKKHGLAGLKAASEALRRTRSWTVLEKFVHGRITLERGRDQGEQ